eukprot:366005_1
MVSIWNTSRFGKSYYINCEECSENYCSIGSSTWHTSGTVARRYGYCPSCCGGTTQTWKWSGNIVKLRCKKCDDMYGLICWNDWKKKSGEVIGYCGDCHNAYEARIKEIERQRLRRRKKCKYCGTWISDVVLKKAESSGVVVDICYKCIGDGICNCSKCDKYCSGKKQFSYGDQSILSSILSMECYFIYDHGLKGFPCCDPCYVDTRRIINVEKRKRAEIKKKEEWDRSWFGQLSNFGQYYQEKMSAATTAAVESSAQYISDKAVKAKDKLHDKAVKAKDTLVDKETWIGIGNAAYDGTKYLATKTKDKLQDPDFQASVKGKAAFCGNNIKDLTKYSANKLVDGANWGIDSYHQIQTAKKQQKYALIIQSFFRGARDRNKYLKRIKLEKMTKREESALVIQSFFRGAYSRNEYLKRIKNEKQKKQKWKGTFDHLLIKHLLDKSVIFPWNPRWNRPQWDPEYMKLYRMMKSGNEEKKEEQPLNLLQVAKIEQLKERCLSIQYPFRIHDFKAHPNKGIFYLSRGFVSNQIDGKGFRQMLLWKAKKFVSDGIIDYAQKQLCPTPVDLIVSTFGKLSASLLTPLVLQELHLPMHLALNLGALHVSIPLVIWAGFALGWIFGKILGKIGNVINKKLYPKLMKAKEDLKTSVAESFGYPKEGEQQLKAGAAVLFCEDEDTYEENGDVMKENDLVEKLKGMTERDLRKRYHELCMKYHPDKGGNEEVFKNLQQRYDRYKSVYSLK